jgi:hypothetical protein
MLKLVVHIGIYLYHCVVSHEVTCLVWAEIALSVKLLVYGKHDRGSTPVQSRRALWPPSLLPSGYLSSVACMELCFHVLIHLHWMVPHRSIWSSSVQAATRPADWWMLHLSSSTHDWAVFAAPFVTAFSQTKIEVGLDNISSQSFQYTRK